MNGNGAHPLTQTFSEARASATWWATPAGSTTPYSPLWQFC